MSSAYKWQSVCLGFQREASTQAARMASRNRRADAAYLHLAAILWGLLSGDLSLGQRVATMVPRDPPEADVFPLACNAAAQGIVDATGEPDHPFAWILRRAAALAGDVGPPPRALHAEDLWDEAAMGAIARMEAEEPGCRCNQCLAAHRRTREWLRQLLEGPHR